jgi:hypothetical protein
MANPGDQKTSNLDLREQKVRATVAQGRTIMSADPIDQVIIGYDADGKPIKRARSMYFDPGQEIELPPDEVKRLRALGYLVDPDAKPLPRGEGPSFTEVGRSRAAAA